MEELLQLFLSLVGVGSLIAVIVNVLKKFGWVKDGDAPTWSVGLNLVGMVALFIVQAFFPNVDVGSVDEIAGSLAQILTLVVGLVIQLLSSKATHVAIKGVPLVGKSYSAEFSRSFAQRT